MKQILWYGSYDTCQMASLESFKGLTHPSDQDLSWEGSPHPKIEKNKFVLKYEEQLFWVFRSEYE